MSAKRGALAVGTLLRREVVRFLRQKDRVLGALGSPIVFWFLIGSGLGGSFRLPAGAPAGGGSEGLSYLQYFFPGTVVLILLFTAVFSTISIIEDRREGFLQGVLVSPVSRRAIVMGKLLGGTILAFGQGLLFLLILPFVGVNFWQIDFIPVCLVLFLMSFGLTAMGFVMAWRLDSTQGFHAVMNLFLLPLWLLSGALFPPSGAPGWLQGVMRVNPLTYSIAALHRGLFHEAGAASQLPSYGISLAVNAFFAAAMFLFAVWVAERKGE
ncbi:MAG: ABC transporter permease [Elusimicrobia bacterium]|nr:ABC transporter permease [Elusimicrobiota bacterium]